jgi:REP element-mobilizing transposase RayT
MNRGAGRQRVFKTDSQRRYFLSLLGETAERVNAEWHAYCLLGNHYHLMVRTPEGNLQRIMRHVNGLYTQYFNRSAHRDGTLVRGRYKVIPRVFGRRAKHIRYAGAETRAVFAFAGGDCCDDREALRRDGDGGVGVAAGTWSRPPRALRGHVPVSAGRGHVTRLDR